MNFFICNYLRIECNKTVGITFNKLHILSPSCILLLTLGKVTAVISYLKWKYFVYRELEPKYLHFTHTHLKEIKTPRGQEFLISSFQSCSMYLDFVLKKLDWGKSIPEREVEL